MEIGQTGYIRDQAVAQVQFYPVQYNSISGELRLYRRIRARVTWDMLRSVATPQALRVTPQASRAASPVYEHILQNLLLNSNTFRQPSGASQALPAGTTRSEGAQTSTATPALKIGVTEDGLYTQN